MKRILAPLLLAAVTTLAFPAHAQIASGSATVGAGGGGATLTKPFFGIPQPGLWQYRKGDSSPGRRELGPVMGFTTSSYTSPIDGVITTWGEKDTWIYEGYMCMSAGTTYTFASCIDDYVSIDIDGRRILNQEGCTFTSASYMCKETGGHPICIRVWDVGGLHGNNRYAKGIVYNTSGLTTQNPDSGWTRLVDTGNGELLGTKGPTSGVLVTAQMRETDPTVMDVDYIVFTDHRTTPTVNVRALAFEDGERGFATVVRPETFIEGTDANIGDGIAANVAHRLSWKVSSDWATDLAKVKFEVMAMKPGDLLLPDMHFVTIPAADGHLKTIVSVNDLSKDAYEITGDQNYYNGIYKQWWVSGASSRIIGNRPLLNALFWMYASGDSELTLSNGVLKKGTLELVRHAGFVQNFISYGLNDNLYYTGSWSLNPNAISYVFGKMGYRLLADPVELAWVNENTRLNLQPQEFRQYAVKSDLNNAEISKPGLWQTVLLGQGSIDQTQKLDDYPVYRVAGPVMAFTEDTYTDAASGRSWTWTENTVFVYRGQMQMAAGTTYMFGSNIDDWCKITIDGKTVLRNTSTSFSSGKYSCVVSGWHDIEIRVGNGGGPGGAGSSSGSNWQDNIGIGYNTSEQTGANNGTGWTRLVDPGDGSLLRTSGVIPKIVMPDAE